MNTPRGAGVYASEAAVVLSLTAMGHPLLSTNPFDVLLRLHQRGTQIDPAFSFWIRNYRDPPIRTVSALIDKCPRVDWLFWFLEECATLDLIAGGIVINAGMHVRYHLDQIAQGKVYSSERGSAMPHTEGLQVLRDFLARTIRNGG